MKSTISILAQVQGQFFSPYSWTIHGLFLNYFVTFHRVYSTQKNVDNILVYFSVAQSYIILNFTLKSQLSFRKPAPEKCVPVTLLKGVASHSCLVLSSRSPWYSPGRGDRVVICHLVALTVWPLDEAWTHCCSPHTMHRMASGIPRFGAPVKPNMLDFSDHKRTGISIHLAMGSKEHLVPDCPESQTHDSCCNRSRCSPHQCRCCSSRRPDRPYRCCRRLPSPSCSMSECWRHCHSSGNEEKWKGAIQLYDIKKTCFLTPQWAVKGRATGSKIQPAIKKKMFSKNYVFLLSASLQYSSILNSILPSLIWQCATYFPFICFFKRTRSHLFSLTTCPSSSFVTLHPG